MSNKNARPESEIFDEIEAVCSQPGILDVIALLCLKDTYVHAFNGEVDADVMAQQYDRSKLSRTELSTLIGLACKNGIVQKPIKKVELEKYVGNIYTLFEELHTSFYQPINFEEVIKNKSLPQDELGSGTFMREAIFYSGEGVYKHQYRDMSQVRYKKDNPWLQINKGFLIEEAADVFTAIVELQLNSINRLISEANSFYLPSYLPMFKFSIQGIVKISKLPVEVITAVVNAFSARPSEGMEGFNNVDDFNHRNAFPIIQLDEDELICFQSYSLWEALYESPFFWFNSDKAYSEIAGDNRGVFTEDFTARKLEAVFGKENVYTNIDIYEGKDTTGEIDVLVLFGNFAFVIQAKSKKLTVSARKGNSKQLKDDFKKAIQDAYDQAYLCSELLQKEGVVFKKQNGDALKFKQKLKAIYPFCVVSDYYPALASQSRQFLKFKVTDKIKHPCVMDVFLIDLLAEMLDTPLFFLDYIQKRSNFADSVISHHELTILATYLKQNLYFENNPDLVMLEDDISAELELAMLARRDGFKAPITPEGMLTLHTNTYIGSILDDIKHSTDYCLLQLGFHFLSLYGETKAQYNDEMERLINKCKKDKRHHDITFGFSEGKSGLTVHCNDDESTIAFKKLATHCEKRKYTCKADTWIGLCLSPKTKQFKFATYHESIWVQSDEMDKLVDDLPKIGRQHQINYGSANVANPIVKKTKKIGRNKPCICGSGKKYKHCCL